ncbi:unnamed protein product [Spirodela intermedia]|uniref:Chalcone--flavanone isomerase n=1 Tax=Spirodela intermedia TaxID=51605 RepID=A0A7I8IZ73_SPIIN|nr:unnamed protein product [Spirodela intermedia]CAA6662883.1 unnamed protein product [Spirodela intermedia]
MVSLRLILSSFPRPPWQRVNAGSSSTNLRAAMAAVAAATVGIGVGLSLSAKMENSGGHFMFNSLGNPSPVWASLSLTTAAEGTLVEPKTGAEFPAVLDGTRRLLGVGLRRKSLFGLKNIDVYAFGVYADDGDIKNLREKYQNLTIPQLKECKEFYADILEQDINMTVRLQIVYSRLSIRSVRSAFEESVGNRLRKFNPGFTSLFKDEYKIPRGSTIDLTRECGHVLHTRIDGKEIGSIESKLLCRSIFDLYIGDEPFDRHAKEEVELSLASLLQD